jgi:signal transduction histidine kinase
VKHVLTLHGGEVSVRSDLGAGSTFRFELPRD